MPEFDEINAPVTIPDHEMLRPIGRGSYGVVWLARSTMGLYRAVKIVYRKTFKDARPFERELSGIRKFEPISRSHDAFIDILHVGINEAEGYFYYVMELGDDQVTAQFIQPERYEPKTLGTQIAQQGRLSVPECLRFGLTLSHGLAELHKHGLVHRDIKPSNIIFINGTPKLADIGLVAEAGQALSFVGTEGFVPQDGPGTPEADVYALGKVLYEAATGKDRHEFPKLQTLLGDDPQLDAFAELNEVIVKAGQNQIKQRYASAWLMHADLLVLANGKSVKRLRALEKNFKVAKRAGVVAFAIVLLAAAIVFPIVQERRHAQERRQREVGANIANGTRTMDQWNMLGALPQFANTLRLDHDDAEREVGHRLLVGSVLAQCPRLERTWNEATMLDRAFFNADSTRALLIRERGLAKLVDLRTGEVCLHPFGELDDALCCGAFHPERAVVAVGGFSGRIRVLRSDTLEEIFSRTLSNGVSSVCFAPEANRLVVAMQNGWISLWDYEGGKLIWERLISAGEVSCAQFDHKGTCIATCGRDGYVRLWDASNATELIQPISHAGHWVHQLAFSPDDTKLATACADRVARVFRVESGEQIPPNLHHGDEVFSVEFSRDGRLLLTGSVDSTARLWETGELLPWTNCPVLPHGERVTWATLSHDCRRALVAGSNGLMRLWDLAPLGFPSAQACLVSDDGSHCLVLSNQLARFWRAAAGTISQKAVELPGTVEKTLFNRNGSFFLCISLLDTNSSTANRLLTVWDCDSGKAAGAAIVLSNNLDSAQLSEDGRHLVTWVKERALLWDVALGTPSGAEWKEAGWIGPVYFNHRGDQVALVTGTMVQFRDLAGHPSFGPIQHPVRITRIEFSPNDERFVTCCADRSLSNYFARIWNAKSGVALSPRLPHGDGVVWAGFSPDGKVLSTACEDFTAHLWDGLAGTVVPIMLRHEHQIFSTDFSPDSRWLLTASRDCCARIWNVATGDPLTPPLRHPQKLKMARFLNDRRRMLTWDDAGAARIWELPILDWPIEEISDLASLLAGETVDPAVWRRLRDRHPAFFTVTREAVCQWHQQAALDAEVQLCWEAAALHWQWLLELDPQNTVAVHHLETAQKQKRSNHHRKETLQLHVQK